MTETEAAAVAYPVPAPKRRWRIHFSLRTLLLVVKKSRGGLNHHLKVVASNGTEAGAGRSRSINSGKTDYECFRLASGRLFRVFNTIWQQENNFCDLDCCTCMKAPG